jgi:uncharacterized protein
VDSSFLTATRTGVRIAVKVHPRSRREAASGVHGGHLKLDVTAPPEEGAANRAVEVLVARLLRVPRRSVAVVVGAASRRKVVAVDGVSLAVAAERIGAVLETSGRR